MTTETESLESVEMALAERFPSMRQSPYAVGAPYRKPDSILAGRDWVPNVTTDGLLEALWASHEIRFFHDWHPVYGDPDHPEDWKEHPEDMYEWVCRLDKNNVAPTPETHFEEFGSTAHEALCRAAKKALET